MTRASIELSVKLFIFVLTIAFIIVFVRVMGMLF
jgi:hypothetical protein